MPTDRAYYKSSITDFLHEEPEKIFGRIAIENSFDLTVQQKEAWVQQANIMKKVLGPFHGRIYFEYSIPRMGKRIDAVVIVNSVVFIIEFKVGAQSYDAADLDQVMDYALDLHNFHEGSHVASLVPILVATNAPSIECKIAQIRDKEIHPPICANQENLGVILEKTLAKNVGRPILWEKWERSGYKPTPTIIEATLALYNGHSVKEISRSDACARNLTETSDAIARVIQRSREKREKSIVMVTGVPGAGKTLVGLNIATMHIDPEDELYSVFLSGNGPLVKILQEALARNKVAQYKEVGKTLRKGDALSEVKAFIQNVHHFRDEGLIDAAKPPVEHVALFDEAQRAWTKEHTSKFMREKKHYDNFDQSEPEFLISCMDRHTDWATVVCLVGGGQEINTGEAGIQEWYGAVEAAYPHWNVYLSDQLSDSEYGAGEVIKRAKDNLNVTFMPELHLGVSVRSFRSEKVSLFVKQLLDFDEDSARRNLADIQEKYPIVMTRDLESAKSWVRSKARGSERYGMVVSSHAERLKPYAIDVRVKTDPVHWFLDGKEDVRSSYYLEDVATEFDVQV